MPVPSQMLDLSPEQLSSDKIETGHAELTEIVYNHCVTQKLAAVNNYVLCRLIHNSYVWYKQYLQYLQYWLAWIYILSGSNTL